MDTDLVRRELKQIEDTTGRLTPDGVIDAARPVEAPLHKYFEWDDSVAANKYRLDQARGMIRLVRISVEVEEQTIRIINYVRDPSVGGREQGYRSTLKLAKEPDDARKAIAAEFAQAEARLQRARDVATSLGFAGEIDKLIYQVRTLAEKIERSAASMEATL